MNRKQLFWDFDGTLYNSYPDITRALQNALCLYQLPLQPEREMTALLKVSVTEAVNRYAAKYRLDEQALLSAFRQTHALERAFAPYDGLRACLTRLAQAGGRHYLYTHRDALAWEHLERDGFSALFSDAVTSEDGYPPKPAPDALLALMARNGLSPADCVMIGDREIDVLAGQNAGMRAILFDPDHFYPCSAADGRAQSMPELCSLLLNG